MKQLVAVLLLASPFLQAEAAGRIPRYYGVFTSPAQSVPSKRIVDGPLLGNGEGKLLRIGT